MKRRTLHRITTLNLYSAKLIAVTPINIAEAKFTFEHPAVKSEHIEH